MPSPSPRSGSRRARGHAPGQLLRLCLVPLAAAALLSGCAARGDRVVYLRDGMLVDTLEQGRWSAGHADSRHRVLLDWLRGHGF